MNNIILIGMSGAGKSTIAMELADYMEMFSIDTDTIMQNKIGKRLPKYIEECGVQKFKELEEQTILELNVDNRIISTGGSVIYSDSGMEHLKSLGKIVYLDVDFETIEKRIAGQPERGIINIGNKTLKDLYEDRKPKYSKWADIVIKCENKSIVDICEEIRQKARN